MADDLSPDELQMLTGLFDVVVPPSDDGRLPGAGSLDVGAHVERLMRGNPMLRPVVDYGLSALADLAAKRNVGGWAALSVAERTEVLREFAAGDQFFMPALLFLVYSGYYQDARVLRALGREPRPPHPVGYPMEDDDPALLAPVRRRARMYRDG